MEGKIYQAVSATMKDIGAVGKSDFNTYDKYKFRSIDAVMNALNPAMIKNGIFVVPTVLKCEREERQSKSDAKNMMYTVLTVQYRFYADDGSYVEAVVIGEAMDRSDKSTNKAMSAAFKYACFQTFCIPTEELLEDADGESTEIGEKAEEQAEKKVPQYISENQQMVLESLCAMRKLDPANVFNGWPKLTQEQYGLAMKRLGGGKT